MGIAQRVGDKFKTFIIGINNYSLFNKISPKTDFMIAKFGFRDSANTA